LKKITKASFDYKKYEGIKEGQNQAKKRTLSPIMQEDSFQQSSPCGQHNQQQFYP